MRGITITVTCTALLLVSCKDKHSGGLSMPASLAGDDYRYYAFKLKAYRDQHGREVENLLDKQRRNLNIAVKFSSGKDDIEAHRDNPFIAVRNMDDPADCYQVESRYDRDADPPIYEKGKANANYRQRLDFHALSPSGREGEVKQFSFRWFWGKKFASYGTMRRFQIKQTRPDKRSIFFLQQEQLKLPPDKIKQQFFNPQADKTCAQAIARKDINRPPVQGIYHHTLVLKKFKGAGKNKKPLDEDMKIALRLDLSATKGGSQYANVIVKDIANPSSCYTFGRHAKTIDWQAYNGQRYSKHIEITKKFGDSDRYYMIIWLLDQEKNAQIAYFYLDERAGGPYYEYAATSPALSSASSHFPSANPAAGCTTPTPKQR